MLKLSTTPLESLPLARNQLQERAVGGDAVVWQRHLAAIEAEEITAKAYAEREGLSVPTLYAWRQRLKQQAGRTRHRWTAVRRAQPAEAAMPVGTSSVIAAPQPSL